MLPTFLSLQLDLNFANGDPAPGVLVQVTATASLSDGSSQQLQYAAVDGRNQTSNTDGNGRINFLLSVPPNADTILIRVSTTVLCGVLAFCPSVTLNKRSYERLAPPLKLSQIVEIRFFRKFQGTTISGPNHFPAGVLSKEALFTKMSVRDANIFTSHEN